jgi:uncharacterized protein (DUF1778 family)
MASNRNSRVEPAEKSARINVRLSEKQHRLIQEAAATTGTTMSDFILVPAIERAVVVLQADQVTHINADVAERFLAWLDEPARVIPAMTRLAKAVPFDS